MTRGLCPVLSLLFLTGGFLYSTGQDFKISDNVDYVLLDVSVRDADGAFVGDLHKSNFKIFEDKRPREITYFSGEDLPLAVGLVVDNSGSMASKRPRVVMAGLAFAKESNPHDEFFVVNFNDSVTRGLPPSVPFTDSLQLLRHALYLGEPGGRTALYDAISYALRHLEFSKLQRRTVIVVSDGKDNASKMSFSALEKDLQASRATVFTIGLPNLETDDLNHRVLKKIAQMTGGQFFEPIDISEIVPVFHEISKDLRHRYTIEYAPDEMANKRVVRHVKVVVRDRGRKLHARTRTTYSIAKAIR